MLKTDENPMLDRNNNRIISNLEKFRTLVLLLASRIKRKKTPVKDRIKTIRFIMNPR